MDKKKYWDIINGAPMDHIELYYNNVLSFICYSTREVKTNQDTINMLGERNGKTCGLPTFLTYDFPGKEEMDSFKKTTI